MKFCLDFNCVLAQHYWYSALLVFSQGYWFRTRETELNLIASSQSGLLGSGSDQELWIKVAVLVPLFA